MPFNAIDTARTGVIDQLVAMYGEAISHTVEHLRQRAEQQSSPMYAYTLGVDSWRAVARRAIPATIPYVEKAELCVMCTLRGMEEVYRDTLTVHLMNLCTGEEAPVYDLTDALTVVLSKTEH